MVVVVEYVSRCLCNVTSRPLSLQLMFSSSEQSLAGKLTMLSSSVYGSRDVCICTVTIEIRRHSCGDITYVSGEGLGWKLVFCLAEN